MSYVNYDDVLNQLHAAGLVVDAIELGRLRRCRVDGDREQRGWYALHEIRLDSGELAIVGTYGVWHGSDNGANKIELRVTVSSEQRAAIRARIAEDRRHAEALRKNVAKRAARLASFAWNKCTQAEVNEYLTRKGVRAYPGVRISDRGNLVIKLHDEHGTIAGVQVIYSDTAVKKRKGRDKDFWPVGMSKRGRFFLIGTIGQVLLICEGYATGASLHEATGLPVAVAFDAGNLLPVAQTIRHRWRDVRILVCADDDHLGRCRACQKMTPQPAAVCMHCGGDTSVLVNTGLSAATATALAVGGSWIAPEFADRGLRKLTDFNDLATESTPLTVRTQVLAKLQDLKWPLRAADDDTRQDQDDPESFTFTTDILLKHFSLIYGSDFVFDGRRRIVLPLSALRSAAGKAIVRAWQEHPGRRAVAETAVVFDPTGSCDPAKTCNLWGGFPTAPRTGNCDLVRELIEYLFGEVALWVLKWLAYPLQNHGAKMHTALLVHSPQGTGKGILFNNLMLRIYGQYGGTVGQLELESQFNAWMSRKLFLVGDEVVARREKYHLADRLKAIITDDRILINEKGRPLREEHNHANLVLLSNRADIASVDSDDRRFLVRWTPPPLSKEFYAAVVAELDEGGVEAFHDFLMRLDLGDFSPAAKPPLNADKSDLIELTRDNLDQFFFEWSAGDLGLPFAPVRSSQLYDAYRSWCTRVGVIRPAPMVTMIGAISKRTQVNRRRAWHFTGGASERVKSWFILPQGAEPPAERTDVLWLSDCVQEFDAALLKFKDKS